MIGWWKCSSGRASDVLWQGLTFAARGLLATLEDAADGSGSVPMPDGTEALARVVGGWQGADQVLLLLAELERAGRVVVDHEGHQLLLPHTVRDDEPRKPSASARAQSARDGSRVSAEGPRKPTRQERHSFKCRERIWRDVPADMTWDAWLATPEGATWLRRSATPRATLATVAATPLATVAATLATPPLPHTLSPQKEQKDRENGASDAREAPAGATPESVATDGSATPATCDAATPRATLATVAATPRCDTVETLTAREITAGDALAALRGDARLRLTLTTPQEAELDRVLGDVAARGQGWTRSGLARLALHLRAQHTAPGRDGRPWVPSSSSLRGDGSWSRLLALYDEADGCSRCAEERDAQRARAAAPPAPPPRAMPTPEERARMSASARELRARLVAQHTTTTEPHHG